MNITKKPTIFVFVIMLMFTGVLKTGWAVEPVITDYSASPVFIQQPVKPNVMIILDNSGSMNFNAYGPSGPFTGKPVSADLIDSIKQSHIGWEVEDYFAGEPYNSFEIQVDNSKDDAVEMINTGITTVSDQTLSLGNDENGNATFAAMRFNNIQIPQGATVTSAWVEFTTQTVYDPANQEALILDIYGEDVNDAKPFIDPFEETLNNISSRTGTTAFVSWKLDPGVEPWDALGVTHRTPELKTIMQEIVNRPGWTVGNPMAFGFFENGATTMPGRSAAAYDLSPSNAPKLHVEIQRSEATKYYGYFNYDYFYFYDGSKFLPKYKKSTYWGDPGPTGYWIAEDLAGNPVNLTNADIVGQGLWDGNWLNWISMRRIDVLRKALMGGLATSRTGGGNQVNYGDSSTKYVFFRHFDSSTGAATSPHHGDYYFVIRGASIGVVNGNSPTLKDDLADVVSGTNAPFEYNIRIQKLLSVDSQDYHFYNGGWNLSGVLQKLWDKVRWGNIFFNLGTGFNQSGGKVVSRIGSNVTQLINDLQNTANNTWTPLAESLYTAMQYFKQEPPDAGLDYAASDVPCTDLIDDPYYDSTITEFVPCAKSFVIMLTDGSATKDKQIPAAYKDYDADGDPIPFDCDTTTYLDDVALYAHTNDLRSSSVGKTDLDGDQNLILYTIYAFGSDDNARQLLKDAARNGGFIDRNGNNLPDGDYSDPPGDRLEWDADGDGNPDNYFEAAGGRQLEQSILAVINDILRRAAAGSAASVLATNSEGEGNMIQAYFRPSVFNGLEKSKWYGYLQSLWMDEYGNLREDTDGDRALDITQDKIVKYFADTVSNDTKVKKFTVSAANPYPDLNVATCLSLGTCVDAAIEEVLPIFEAGSNLAARNPDERKIFTFIDKDNDMVVDEATYNAYDTADEVVTFGTSAAALIKPYLGVASNLEWNYLGDTHDKRTNNLIEYVRGKDAADLSSPVYVRNRTLNNITWKLGDIVHSTPVTVAKPAENFNIIYADKSYQAFFNAVKDRETMVYVGANDGMLHAFTSWELDHATGSYVDPYPTDGPGDSTFINGEQIGDEVWAFIPQTLLPHLKWLANPDYVHSYYVDLSPKVFDAKILPDDTHYTDADTEDNWGSFLIGGLNMGGKHIWSQDDFGSGVVTRDFYPSYFCLDITDPRNPVLLWERTYANLGMSRSMPAIVKVEDKWFAVFGSGPTDYEGESTQNGYIFVVDLKTGAPIGSGGNDWLFGPLEDQAFMNTAVTLDHQLNYNVDAIYFGEAYKDPIVGDYKGKVYKVTIPCSACDWDVPYTGTFYDDNPVNWTLSNLFDCDQPLTTPMALSADSLGNAWVYFGTGRYIAFNDRFDESQQYLYGIKDPFFNPNYNLSFYHNFGAAGTLTISDLFSTDDIEVTTSGTVLEAGVLHDGVGTWGHLLDTVRLTDGWYRTLDTAVGEPSERAVSKSAILGGIVFSPTFTPNRDICGFGGNSNFYALHYETGTAYTQQVFLISSPSFIDVDGSGTMEEKVEFKLQDPLIGAPPPSVGMHIGRNKGATAFLQMSTGQVIEMDVDPILTFRSGLVNWQEQ